MRISQQTIQHFADKGISVRWYPQQSYEEFLKECWKKEYNYVFKYHKDNVRGSEATKNGRTNILFDSMEEFEAYCRSHADRYAEREARPYEYNKLFIEYDGKMIVKKENVKSKEITIEMIDKLIAKNEKAYKGAYGQFALKMQKLLKENKLNSLSVCPTTYGIGVWVIYNWNADEQVQKVAKILKEKGVEFYNEYSEAGWVYRFKVSKKADNLAKIC